MSSVALQEFLGKRKDKKLCNKAVEVENPGKQTTGGPSQWGKEKKTKKQSRVVSWRKHLFHIRAFQAEMQRSPRPLTS